MKNYIKSSWIDTKEELLDPKLTQQIFISKNVIVVQYVYKPGLEFREHSHPQEQITIVQSGILLAIIDGEKVELKVGDICLISPNVVHSVNVLGDEEVKSISIFTPVADKVIIEN